ncbi:TetR/AcrR family transcriptional regulator [Prauserella muralis]|uniref:Transcriptional regulator n=1 Tax=Prauserella muralis TaxID=588067 RepID=A0A2V4AH47_9PSEU|nr:TetR/AcrR family transcriptional regulator [Prauserella muralis]PXY19242.1 transcriptional regulator [Prauserella muralis]TWE29173.1 TetR family transcriptional regulator [Prauserella muralis]
MQSRPPRDRARAGRPRSAHIDLAVLDATLAVLDTVGYGRFTIEEVARRAGTTKPAVYRRWPTRQQLVLAALARRLGDVTVPDTGCTLCDLGEGLAVFVAAFDRMPPGVLAPLLADCSGDAGLHDAFMRTLFAPPRAAVERMLARATARGDLREDLDLALAVDLLGSLVHYRVLFGHATLRGPEIERAVETLLQGMATDYPRLVEHSRRLAEGAATHELHT